MTVPPASRPSHTDPGGIQARAEGQQIEVPTYEGDLIGMVSLTASWRSAPVFLLFPPTLLSHTPRSLTTVRER